MKPNKVEKMLSVFLNIGIGSLVSLSLSEEARACDPNAIQLTAMAPAIVNVPVGGNARVVGLVRCTTNANDFPAGGNQANYQIRLVDEDAASDDVMGTNRDTFNRVPGQGAAFPRRIKLNYTLNCPAATPRIEGTENSGEGQPGAGDPADLVLEIDNGANTNGTNHYPANLVGNPAAGITVPAECVLGLGEEDQVSTASTVKATQQLLARTTFLGSAETFQAPTGVPVEVALGDYTAVQVKALWTNIGKGFLGTGQQFAMLNVPTNSLGVDLSETTLRVAQELLVAYSDLTVGDPAVAADALENAAVAWNDVAGNSGRLVFSERMQLAYYLRQLSSVFAGLAVSLRDVISAGEGYDPELANRVIQFDMQRAEASFFLNQLALAMESSQLEPSLISLTVGTTPESFLVAPGDAVQLFSAAQSRYSCELSRSGIGSGTISIIQD